MENFLELEDLTMDMYGTWWLWVWNMFFLKIHLILLILKLSGFAIKRKRNEQGQKRIYDTFILRLLKKLWSSAFVIVTASSPLLAKFAGLS